MVTYQIQYKETTAPSTGVGEAKWGVWKVVAEMHSLKSALNSAKTLIKKYGYDRIQICRSTKMNVKVELES
jgi:hypothetical protein